jgi:DNA-binding NtrC family response regulator
MDRKTILVVDDQDLMRESLQESLERSGYSVRAFSNGKDAVKSFLDGGIDAVITDLKMPEMSGIEVLNRCKQIAPDVPVIVITAFGTVDTAVQAMKQGAFDYIKKPFEPDEVDMVLRNAVERRALMAENEYLRARVGEDRQVSFVVGDSRAMKALVAEIDKISGTSSTVFLYGESGTGKEVVARTIHARSPRAGSPFLAVNCAALSAGLLESELFGHEKGAFTGADRMRKGRFELAHGGTLLLDEVSEIDINLQAKLLRVLQEREFERVGSSDTRRADVRVIATTNRDLTKAVRDGKFREDLYFRLNVLPLRVPPLRERIEDIPALVEHFIEKCALTVGRRLKGIVPEALRKLEEYHWPGNVRELENIIERAAVLAASERIEVRDVSPSLDVTRVLGGSNEVEITTVDEMERRLVRAVLERFDWHQKRSAEVLGLGVRTLRDKMKKWDLRPARQKMPA